MCLVLRLLLGLLLRLRLLRDALAERVALVAVGAVLGLERVLAQLRALGLALPGGVDRRLLLSVLVLVGLGLGRRGHTLAIAVGAVRVLLRLVGRILVLEGVVAQLRPLGGAGLGGVGMRLLLGPVVAGLELGHALAERVGLAGVRAVKVGESLGTDGGALCGATM